MSSLPTQRRNARFVAHPGAGDRKSVSRSLILVIAACMIAPLAIAYGFGSHSELIVCAVIIGAAGLAIGLANPFWALIFFVALLYARPEETIPGMRGLHMMLIASIVASVSVVFQKMMDKEAPVRFPINGLIVGFGAIMVLSTFKTGGANALTAVQEAGKLVALVLMICNLAQSPGRYKTLANAVIVFTVYLALYSIVQYYTGFALKRGAVLQAEGTGMFQDPNDLSASIVAGMALALCHAVAAQGGRRLLFVSAVVVMAFAVYLTNSRGGMLAMVATIAVFVMIYSRSRWIALALVVALGAGAVKYGPSRMKELDTREESANSRFRFWNTGTQVFIANPLIGAGYDNFTEVNSGMTAHNSFVLCYSELGLPGYFCWVGMLYYALRGLKRRGGTPEPTGARGSPDAPAPTAAAPVGWTAEKHELVGARLALAGYLLAGFWISRTYSPPFFLLVALPLAHQIAYSAARTDFTLKPSQRWADTWAILGICVASIAFIALLAARLKG